MSQLKVSMTFETDNPEQLASILSHHADYLIDFDNNHDIVSSVENVQSYEIGTKHDGTKLSMLSDIIEDILPDGKVPEPSDLNEDDDMIALYDCIHALQKQLSENGY